MDYNHSQQKKEHLMNQFNPAQGSINDYARKERMSGTYAETSCRPNTYTEELAQQASDLRKRLEALSIAVNTKFDGFMLTEADTLGRGIDSKPERTYPPALDAIRTELTAIEYLIAQLGQAVERIAI